MSERHYVPVSARAVSVLRFLGVTTVTVIDDEEHTDD